jgi:hypothetical protein
MMIIPTTTDDTITGIITAVFTKKIEETLLMSRWLYPLEQMIQSRYDSSDCIICSSGYNHRDINNVSSIFLVKSALMIPVIVSSVLVGKHYSCHDDYTH